MKKRWFLNTVDILTQIPEEERTYFFERSQKKRYRKGTVIFAPGDESNLIYYVLTGRVKIYNLSMGGKEVIYWFCNAKDFFGLAELCGGEQRAVFAESVEDSEVLLINKANFQELIRRNPTLSFELMRVFGSRIRHAHDTIKDLILCDVPSRLAQLIIKLGEICGESTTGGIVLTKKFTHQEMADMIGATRTTVTEVLSDFKRMGYIKYDTGKITILDAARLASLIGVYDR